MIALFETVNIPTDAPESPEALGSKPKFWFQHEELGLCLYKMARPGTGEDWSEKAAEQLAGFLGLPHARYELASWRSPQTSWQTHGVLTPTLVPPTGRLILGNELLVAKVRGYQSAGEAARYRNSQHTLNVALELIGTAEAGLPPGWDAPAGIETTIDLFTGYLLLDAWIGNTDRHHENWAFIEQGTGLPGCSPVRSLAPTFDHASCLGRNESDVNREKRLYGADKRYSVVAYTAKTRSAFYSAETDIRPLTTLEAFRLVATAHPWAARAWLSRPDQVTEKDVQGMFLRFPEQCLSPLASAFAQALLRENKRRLPNV